MARFRVTGLIVLLLCFSLTAIYAGIEKDGDEREMLRVVTVDPNSTFDVGELSGKYPYETISVPVYFSTAAQVTEIENWIYWDDDDLDYVGVTPGPGIPAEAVFLYGSSNDTLWFNASVGLEDAFTIGPADPIAYLQFEVQCFGYNQTTDIHYVDQNNYNYYIAGGNSFAPLREDGSVTMVPSEGYWDLHLGADITFPYTGQEHIPMDIYFYQEIPGKLTEIWLLYDDEKLQVDSITADPEYIYSFSWEAIDDTIKIDIPSGSNPILPYNQNVEPLTMHLGLTYCDDGTFDDLDVVRAYREEICGSVVDIPLTAPGSVRVPLFITEGDVADINCYDNASSYLVPFYMDATQPVNRYEFCIDFDADSLEFDEIVAYGSFTKPGGQVTGVDNNILKITSGIPTDYDPDDLRSRVFYIKFNRLYAPTVGQVFNFTFNTDQGSTNFIEYDSDYCGYYEADSLALNAGSITIIHYIPPPPPPPCPTLYVWNGRNFVRENTILSACANGPVESDVTDYYLLGRQISAGAEGFRFQIREDATEKSTFSGFELIAVDHPEKEAVKVTADGRIISLGSMYGVVWAKDHKGEDITGLIGVKDDVSYFSEENGWFDVSFGKLKPAQISDFVAVLSSSQPKDPPPQPKMEHPDDVVVDKKLKVYFKTKMDTWELFAEKDPRSDPSIQATVIDPGLIDPDRELVLRYEWDKYYKIDAVEFREARPFEGPMTSLAMTAAVLTKDGTVLEESGNLTASAPIVLRPGEKIDLTFSAKTLGPIARGIARDYVFVSRGRYATMGEEPPEIEKSFYSLEANYPNPFNPSTSIRFNMLAEGHAELRVYDVRGSLVRTLVSGIRPAGRNEVIWDGLSNTGNAVASGVYFYQLKTKDFEKTRKMILLR